jgi:hypothetical protein
MNSFPVKSGISKKWSPCKLVSGHKLDAKLHCRSPFGLYCEVHVDPDITNTLDPRTKWAICMGPTGNLQGSYKFLSLTRKFTEMPIMESVIKQVETMAVEDGAVIGINFKDRKGFEYEFDNNKEYKLMVEPDEPAPFPDIPTEAPGMLTELQEAYGVDKVVQDEPKQSDEQRAILAAENSGIDFSSIPTKVSGGEVIKILDDNEEDAIDEYKQEEVLVKMEPKRKAERAEAGAPGGPRRSNRARIANQQFEDYELYVTVEEEELMMAMMGNNPAEEEEDENVLAAVHGSL